MRRLRRWAKRFGLARTVYGALKPAIRALNRHHIRVLDSAGAFAPNSAGGYRAKAGLTLQAASQTFPFLAELVETAGHPSLTEIDANDFSANSEDRAAASSLKALFDRHGSDKATNHNYHLIYGHILVRPESIRTMLEVGLGTNNEDVFSNMGRAGKPGASVRALRDYLPRAQVFGADVDRRILFSEERIQTFFVDQTDPATVDALCGQLPELDLVIDDGLHSPNANIAIVSLALKKLTAGGWVVVEDIGAAAVPVWQVVASLLPKGWERWLIHADGGLVFAAQRTTSGQ